MTTPANKKGDRSRDEVLAGEYVLGVLPPNERQNVENRLRDDREFALIVGRWQANLSGSGGDYAGDDLAALATSRYVEASYFSSSPAGAPLQMLWHSTVFWRGLALVSLSAAVLFTMNAIGLLKTPETVDPVASLETKIPDLGLNAFYDEQTGALKFMLAAQASEKDKALKVWLVDNKAPPKSLGVLSGAQNSEIIIPPALRQRLKDGARLEVSLEPAKTLSDSKPTGAILASGKILTARQQIVPKRF